MKIRGKNRVIICNKIIETYEYEHEIFLNEESEKIEKEKPKKQKNKITKKRENKIENRLTSNWRARKNMRRIINTNAGIYPKPNGEMFPPVFLTLTFGKHITEIQRANKKFTAFIKKLNYRFKEILKRNLAYTGVIEFQKKGRIHYHIVFYNLPFIHKDRIAEIWGNGFIKIKKTDDIPNLGSYLGKYMGKVLGDSRLCGKKSYFSSRGLKQPKKLVGEKAKIVSEGLKKSLKPDYERNCENEYVGKYVLRFYHLPE